MGSLVFPLASAATLKSAPFQPFALTIKHPVNRLTTRGTTILGLVAARLEGRLMTSRPFADGSRRQNFCCVTTRRRNFGIFRGLRQRRGAPPARPLGLGVLGFSGIVLASLGLPLGGLPAPHETQTFGVLAVTLVPTLWRVLAPTAFAQAQAWSRTPTAVWLMMTTAHGRV